MAIHYANLPHCKKRIAIARQDLGYATELRRWHLFLAPASLSDAPFDVYDVSPIIPVTLVHEDVQSASDVYAGYAQGTFDFGKSTGINGLSATAGVRFADERFKLKEVPGST